MGVRINGYREEIFHLNSALHQITLLLLCISAVSTISMFFAILYTQFIGNKRYTYVMIVALLLAFLHQIITILFLFTDTPPILDWFSTLIGMSLLLLGAISHTEVLYFFACLTKFWNEKRIRILQWLWVSWKLICTLEAYVHLFYLGQDIPSSISGFYFPDASGIPIFSATVSVYYCIQSFHIIYLVYGHFKVTKKDTLHLRIPRILRFIAIIVVAATIDVLGVFCFAIGPSIGEPRAMWTIGVNALYIHITGMAAIFYELKFITIVKDETISMEKRTELPRLLHNQSVNKELMATIKISVPVNDH
jgi:hypothetical protein